MSELRSEAGGASSAATSEEPIALPSLGTATTAKTPSMTMTMINSTRVKPFDVF